MAVTTITVTDHLRDGRTPLFTRSAFLRLADAARAAGAAGDVLLVLRALPGTFCAGADLDDARGYADRPEDYLDAADACWDAIESGAAPVVVAVDGPAVGGAFELCLAADAVVASDRAWFSLPEAAFGLPPLSAARRLAGAVGRSRAREIVLSGRRIPSLEALTLGLVTRTADPDGLEQAAREVAASLSRSAGPSARAVKGVLAHAATERDVAREWFVRAMEAR
jgi:enoyl-CoA hydratase/carnithine racemase